jgi:ribosomal protein S18 acetylase RimI-like enzyme
MRPSSCLRGHWPLRGVSSIAPTCHSAGDLLGAAWVRQLSGEEPGYGYVDDDTPELSVAVARRRRGRGVGTALLARLLESVPRCSLSVDDRNPAVRLYARFGFEVISVKEHSLTMLRG